MLKRIKCKDRKEWLEQRRILGIGASDAAVVYGLMPFGRSRVQLWNEIVNHEKAKDISDNPAVSRGNRIEPALREMFKAVHPEYKVEYHQFDILHQAKTTWIFATLDGELTDADGRKGVLEIKSCIPNSKTQWEEWRDRIPQNYYMQTLHQLLATGYDFVIVYAALFHIDGTISVKEYMIERKDHEENMKELRKVECDFWSCCLTGKIPPPLIGGI